MRELRGRFYRLPPKDDSYRSPDWDPGLPVDLPPFLAGILKAQVKDHPRQPCSCVSQHEGSGRYVFLGPDGGHYRRSNYSRRVFRPACDGRHLPIARAPGRLVIADQTTAWPGTPIAAWPPATETTGEDNGYQQPRGHGIAIIPEDTPLACWLPIKLGLTPHGLRHSHKTWMEGRVVASDASFRRRRGAGPVRAAALRASGLAGWGGAGHAAGLGFLAPGCAG